MANIKGTAIPNSGYVEKVYINNSLSVEEVLNIIVNADLPYTDTENGKEYTVLKGTSVSNYISILYFAEMDLYAIYYDLFEMGMVWLSNDAFAEQGLNKGWNSSFSGVIEFNENITSAGTENSKLTSLFSITPFTSGEETTADKLQKALDNKQLIVDSVNAKAGTSYDIHSKPSDIANTIINIETGGSGTDTSDATATTSDILKGKTAYTADGKVEGMIETYDGENENGVIVYDMLQAKVDYTNSCRFLFQDYTGDNVDFISGLDTSKVTDMRSMFNNCRNLATVPQINTNSANNIAYMYYYCSKIPTIDITYYNISSTSATVQFAYYCSELKSLIIRGFGEKYVIDTSSLQYSGIENGTGYIYVPRNMVDTLKSATNWSTYASQIRALEDYTVDGTTAGALDESKI